MKEANLRIHCGVSNSGDFPSECCTNLYQNHISTFNAVVSLLHFMILSLRIRTQIRDPQIAPDMTAPTDLLHLL